MGNFQEKSAFIYNLANILRNSYKQNEYQKVILPFTVLKRFDSVLEHSKKDIVETYNKYKDKMENIEGVLLSKAKDENGNPLNFYNYSKYNFNTLLQDPDNIEENLIHYIDSFSDNVKDIFENFEIKREIRRLSKFDLLYLIIKKFALTDIDLSPKVVSNHEMGMIFEELIRRFSETSNEEAGQHFTPRDVVKLMTELMFADNEKIPENSIKKVYDPACGTGGMLTSCKEFIENYSESIDVVLYGQEINPEIYAICKADILMKGEEANNIKGPSSTLSHDQLKDDKFDYIISNPPYGTNWEKDKPQVDAEAELGFDGRFGAGTPDKGDGQLLFIQHMISKMKTDEKSRIAVITNGSPLFKGDAGTGGSNIRKWIIENDYLETLVALPDQLFFNTGIQTYIWILTNEKNNERKGKVQLIDAREEYVNMRTSLGEKRHEIPEESMHNILNNYNNFKENTQVKIFDNEDFGYTEITVERPKQLNYQVSEKRLQNLYTYNQFKKLNENRAEDIKNALCTIPNKKYKNWDEFETKVQKALQPFELKKNFINKIIECLSEHDDTADYVTDKKGNPKPDTNLRDKEKIPLKEDINKYFKREVLKYYPHAWIDTKKDKIGYKINFTQYFYVYEPPRPLEEIEADIKKITAEIQKLI